MSTSTVSRRKRAPLATRTTVVRTALLAVLAVFVLFPVYWMIMTAIMPSREMVSSDPPLLPDLGTLSFDSFIRVFEIRPVHVWLMNSTFVMVTTTVAVVALSAMSGYGLSRAGGRLGQLMGFSLFGIRLIPTTLLVIPFFIMFNSIGLRNSLFSLVIANTVVLLPFATWLMKSVFDGVPIELEEAAHVDGSTRIGAFIRIVLPIAKAGIGATAIFAAISAWSDFAFARILVQGEANTTITVGLVGFIGEYTVDWGSLMAAGLLSILPMIILFILVEPLLVSGLTQGAVK